MRKSILTLSVVIIMVLVISTSIEVLSRLFYRSITPNSGRYVVNLLLQDKTLTHFAPYLSHPYMFYINKPGWKASGFTQNNRFGYRGKDFSLKHKKNVLRILTLGGSTTYNFPAVLNPNKTWSADLKFLLSHELHEKIEVINGGLNAGTSAEILAQYIFKHRYLKADVVIIHTGWNDSGPLILSNYDPTYGNYRRWGHAIVNLRKGEYGLIKKSYFFRAIYAWWFNHPRLSNWLGFPKEYFTISRKKAIENTTNNIPIGFKHNLSVLIKLIIADGAKPILFEVPTAPLSIFKVHPDAHAERIYPALQIAHNKNNEVMSALAKYYHIPLIVLPTQAIPLEDYMDHAHVNQLGDLVKARFLAIKLPNILHSG
jgi:hypothetical protein